MAGRQVWDKTRGMFVSVDSGPFQGRGYAENMESQAGYVYRDEQGNRGTRGGQNDRGSRGGQYANRGNRGAYPPDSGNREGYSGNRGGHHTNRGNRGGYSPDSGNREGYSGNREGHNVNSGNRGGQNVNRGNRGGHSGNRGGHDVNSGDRGEYNENRGGHSGNREGQRGNRGGQNVNHGNRGGHSGNRGGPNLNSGDRGEYNENRGGHSGNREGHRGNRGGQNINRGNRGGPNVNIGDGAEHNENRGGHSGNREGLRGNRGGQNVNHGNRGGHSGNRGGPNLNSGDRGEYNENRGGHSLLDGNRGGRHAREQRGGLLPTPELPPYLPQMGPIRPLIPPSNLRHGDPIHGSSTSISGSQYGQHQQNFNQDKTNNKTPNKRGKNMRGSFSTSSLNMVGARPKEFSHGNQRDNNHSKGKPTTQDARYSGKNDENGTPRTQDTRFDQNSDECNVKRNRHENARHRGQRPERVNQNTGAENNEDDSESRATENRGNRGQNQPDKNRRIPENVRNPNTRRGRGYGRSGYRGRRATSSRGRNGYANVNNRMNEKIPYNSHDKEKEEIDNIDDGNDNTNDEANKSKSKSRHGRRGRGTRGRWSNRGRISDYRNKKISSVGQIEDDATSDCSSIFGSTISLVSEQSEVSEQDVNQSNIDLKLDDLHQARILTLKNREKRYKYRLNDLKKMAPHETVKIARFEEGLALIGHAIKSRTKTNVPHHSEAPGGQHDSNNGQELQVEDLDKMSPKPVINSGDDSSTETMPSVAIKLPRKATHLFSKTRQISFKPKRNQKKECKAKDSPIQKPEFVSDSSDEEIINSDEEENITFDDDTNVIERQDETEIKKKRIRKRRPKKSKEDNREYFEQNKGKTGTIDDLMSELDNLCKKDNTKDNELDNIAVHKTKDKPFTCSKDMSQQSAHQSKPPGGGLIFAFEEESKEQIINSFDCEADLVAPAQKERSNATANKQPKSKPDGSPHRDSSMSESQADPNEGPQINAVFKCLVKQLGAESTPEDIVRKSDIFPSGCDVSKWFRRNRKRFNLVERNGDIVNVMAFHKDITYCLDYITKRSCDKPDCERYHVCKDFLCGNCAFGDEQCKFSHDFLDKRSKNLSISKRLGYNTVFTNSEIRSIVSVKYPRICVAWNENGSCNKANCTGLHICQRFILGDCFDDEAVCTFSHDKFSEHNKPILAAYNMCQWNDRLFKRMIFITRSPRQRTVSPEDAMPMDEGTERGYPDLEEGATAMEVQYSPPENVVLEEKVLPVQKIHRTRSRDETRIDTKPETAKLGKRKTDGHLLSDDSISDRFICDVNITSDGCKNTKCKNLHLIERIPYIWQLKEWDANIYVVQVKFDGHLHAFVSLVGHFEAQNKVDVRRLSTRSYMLGNYRSQTYKTQWRWSFKDDMQEWKLFEPNMQYTLEQKFLANQKEYLYSRDNYKFKYMFSFSSMKQTNLDTWKSRDAIRRPIFISREDIEMGSFPESMKAPPKIQTDLPRGWAPWDLCNRFEFVKLLSESIAYRDVEASFFKTLDRHKFIIDDIFRVQNPDLWSAYCTEEKVMQANLERSGQEGAVIEKRLLFHGTDSLDAVRGIAINNFDPRISGKNATVYGTGAYFARDSKYSNCYTSKANKDRYMFRATVLIGEYTQSKKEYTRPPPKRSKDHELYDSCVNNVDNPEIFILFDRPKYYPEYLVTYHEEKPIIPADDVQIVSGVHSRRVSSSIPRAPTSGSVSASPSGMSFATPPMSYPSAPVSPQRPRSPVRTHFPSTNSFQTPPSPAGTMSYNTDPFVRTTRRSLSPTLRYPTETQTYRPNNANPKSPTKKDNGCSIQ